MPIRVIIDTDPGVDDALALLLGLLSPELQVEAITTVCGNVSVDMATRNVFRVLSLLAEKPWPPVARGADRPLKNELKTAAAVHGEDGLGNLERYQLPDSSPRYPDPEILPAPQGAIPLLFNLLDRFPGEISLIALGPLTNLAQAILRDPGRMQQVREIILMGGAMGVPGNVTPVAEFNIYTDPEAAQIVFRSGLPLTVVPLDVTRQVRLTRKAILEEIQPLGTRIGQFIVDSTAYSLELFERIEEIPAITLHDPLAVGVAVDPSLLNLKPLFVDVEIQGEMTRGMTVADLRPIAADLKAKPNARVARAVDGKRFLNLFRERLCPESSS